jgi:hypothetical protein
MLLSYYGATGHNITPGGPSEVILDEDGFGLLDESGFYILEE